MKVTLVRATTDAKMAMAQAGSNCYDSIAKEGIVDHCYKSGHHSVMEFADFHFHIEGVSRALSHQLVRHRLASFAQRSQRYCKEDGFGYVTPSTIPKDKIFAFEIPTPIYDENGEMYCTRFMKMELSYELMMELIEGFYTAMVADGVPAEDARYILPNACDTVIDVKMNFRTLMNFMNERLCSRSQWEIRKMALLMKEEIMKYDPKLAKYLVPKCEAHAPYNFCFEDKEHGWCRRQPHITEFMKVKSNE